MLKCCCLVLLASCLVLLPTPAIAAFLKLTPTSRSNDLGNPIYSLSAVNKGETIFRVDAVSGTNKSQHRDRNKGDNYAPLPDGNYDIGAIEPGINPEAGRNFVRIRPRFRTRRTHLGIHLDVSYNHRNGRDGTAGCVGITTKRNRDRLVKWVRKYNPQRLRVKIA
jgi:hypothetical protein